MKKTLEIDDTLDERVETAKEELADTVRSELKDGKSLEKIDEDICDTISEIADSNTPVYYGEINDIFYLNGSEVEEAFDDAGIGEKNEKDFPCGWKAAAICFYIEAKLNEYWQDELKGKLETEIEEAEAGNLPESICDDGSIAR